MNNQMGTYNEEGLFVFSKEALLDRGYCCRSGCRNCPYGFCPRPRIISFVPSWTETLWEMGLNVVGRTRFCIHPSEGVKTIPVCGGTKDAKLQKIKEVKPDLLILDKEENPREFADLPYEYLASHIESVDSVPIFLNSLIERIPAPAAEKAKVLRSEWLEVIDRRKIMSISDLPGIIEWITAPEKIEGLSASEAQLVYLVWRDPWICITRNTFIGSMLSLFGQDNLFSDDREKYPKISLEDLDPRKHILLFSTEPYSFTKIKDEIKELGFSSALIDGESYSWFGVRSLRFLQKHLL